jgi:hypothetical protein
MQLEAKGIASNERHDGRVHLVVFLPSFLPLPARPALVVESDDIFRLAAQGRYDESDARE